MFQKASLIHIQKLVSLQKPYYQEKVFLPIFVAWFGMLSQYNKQYCIDHKNGNITKLK